MESLHGHEVIKFIKEANPPIRRDVLIASIEEKFKDTHFYTCSDKDMSAEDLVKFFEDAGKLTVEDGRSVFGVCSSCSSN